MPQANLTLLDPIFTTAAVTANHAWMVYDTLFGVDAALQPKPQMADGYTVSDNGRTYLIKLRDGLKWHDGEPVRAQDCAPSLARWSARDTFGQTVAKAVDAWGVEDDKTIKITLKKPFPLLIVAIALQNSFMMPERLAQTVPFKAITEAVGSGPFRFLKDEFVAGSSAAWEKNDAYVPRHEPAEWTSGGKIAHFQRIEWKIIPMPPLHRPRCRVARWTGTNRHRPIWFRCCVATATSSSHRPIHKAISADCNSTICIRRSTMSVCGARCRQR